jgi:molybdenum cofactor cytidylyltransferase
MVVAVIPAAGTSSRMGRPKLSLPLGPSTILETLIHTLRDGGIGDVLVVTGPNVPELVPLAKAAGAEVCMLSETTADMRATVEHGLRWIEERLQPQDGDAWLLAPADHPALESNVVRELVRARNQTEDFSIWVPTYQGKRGHPTLLLWKHVQGIRTLPPGQGINVYLRQHAAQVAEVPVETECILCDLDRPEDYERLLRSRSVGSASRR